MTSLCWCGKERSCSLKSASAVRPPLAQNVMSPVWHRMSPAGIVTASSCECVSEMITRRTLRFGWPGSSVVRHTLRTPVGATCKHAPRPYRCVFSGGISETAAFRRPLS